MNVKRFTARTSREALALVKQEFGEDAVVMSTRPCPEGVEVVAMASDSVMQLERVGASSSAAPATTSGASAGRPQRPASPVSWTAPERSAASRVAAATRQAAAGPASQPPAPWASVQGRQRLEPSMEPALHARAAWAADEDQRLARPARESRAEALATPGASAAAPNRGSSADASVQRDVKELEMSTLSFQEYVRQRMLKRRDAEMAADASAQMASQPAVVSPIEAARKRLLANHRQAIAIDERQLPVLHDEVSLDEVAAQAAAAPAAPPARPAAARAAAPAVAAPASTVPQRREQTEMMSELRSMRGLIEQRFGALAFMEKLQRQPRQAQLAQRLLDAGFSPGLIRRLVDGLPADVEEQAWAATVLERNLMTGERDAALEEQGSIYAMIGTTGVGKTTSTAKLAAAFAATHGASNLGLVTLDAYRVGAHEQLRTYGRILGVPVHTAHDRASLEDLLDLLSGKRMVLIDTAGMAQRDSRTRELLEMVSHSAIKRLLVINASAQGETIEDQLAAYAAQSCCGVVLSKLDEAVKLGPALDSMVRHKLKVVAVANGQRVPEDWHRLSANALVQRALRGGGSPAWKLSDNEVNLIFAGLPITAPVVSALSARA